MSRRRRETTRDRLPRSALDALRAMTSTDVELLIASKTEIGANERNYLEAIAKRWQGFAKQSGKDLDTRVYQAEGHFRVALLWQELGRREEACAEYRAACTGRKALVEQFPAVPAYQEDLAKSHLNLAILLAEMGKRDEAQTEFQSAVERKKTWSISIPRRLNTKSY